MVHGSSQSGHYSIERVFDYLGLVFSFLFYPNNSRFAKQVKLLRKADVPLFSRLRKLKDDCSDIVIEPQNREFVQNAYFEFASEMNKWFTEVFEGAIFADEV